MLSYFLSIITFSFGCPPILEAIQNYQACECGEANTKRIVGGSLTQPNEYPWQVLVYSYKGNEQFICGGSIITKKHILTADHCVSAYDKGDIEVYLGAHDRSHLPIRNKISDVSRHTSQLNLTATNHTAFPDVAILTLEIGIESFTEKIRPICFPSKTDDLFEERFAIVTGWGNTIAYNPPGTDSLSNYLKKADVMVTSNENCKSSWGGATIFDFNICTVQRPYQYEEKESFCQGDSGGPLAVTENGRLTLLGVVSYNSYYACNMISKPDVYTRVGHSSVMKWIKGVLKKEQGIAWDDKCQEI